MGKIILLTGNIVDDEILNLGDAIVLPTNPMMRCGAGVSGAIFHKAGVDALESYTRRRFKISYYDTTRKNEMRTTETRVTPGFALQCDIIFAQGPRAYEYACFQEALDLLLITYRNVVQTALDYGYTSILLPALGTGTYGFTHDNTAEAVIRLLRSMADKCDLTIYFVVLGEETRDYYFQFFES